MISSNVFPDDVTEEVLKMRILFLVDTPILLLQNKQWLQSLSESAVIFFATKEIMHY